MPHVQIGVENGHSVLGMHGLLGGNERSLS